MQKFKETKDSQYIYQNKLDTTCFQGDKILRIYLEEHLLIKYRIIKHLILLKVQSMTFIKETPMV